MLEDCEEAGRGKGAPHSQRYHSGMDCGGSSLFVVISPRPALEDAVVNRECSSQRRQSQESRLSQGMREFELESCIS